MEFSKSQKLKEEWGNKPRDHPGFEKVYFTGAFLLNYSCIQCGADFTISQKLDIEETRKGK